MKNQNPSLRPPPPPGGRRNHSVLAPFYREVCRLRAKRHTWEEIAGALSAREGIKINRSALWKMWDNRQRGAVREEFMPPEPQAGPQATPAVSRKPDPVSPAPVPQPPKIILKVRSRKSGVPPLL